MSVRLRRLAADYEKLRNELAGNPYIKVEPLSGNPPEHYLVTYKVKGLKLDQQQGHPVETNFHQVDIYLTSDYPREMPVCKIRTEIFHPNFSSQKVCIGDNWAAGESMVDVIIQIGQMIQYQSYNPKSPLNAVAARWATENEHLFPISNIDLYQPEPEIDIDIQQEDDLDIDLFDAPVAATDLPATGSTGSDAPAPDLKSSEPGLTSPEPVSDRPEEVAIELM
jgi:ubiquitin-protein ligase